VQEFYTGDDGLILGCQADVFYAYDGNAYRERETAAVHTQLYLWLEKARIQRTSKKNQTSWLDKFKPTASKVNEVMGAIEAIAFLDSSYASPCWLDGEHADMDPFDILPCPKGLLHIPTRTLLTPTPKFFALNALDIEFNPQPPEPKNWLKFLDDQWIDDSETKETLQELLGYLLTPRTHL
jgi:putative DNA primase/helicase